MSGITPQPGMHDTTHTLYLVFTRAMPRYDTGAIFTLSEVLLVRRDNLLCYSVSADIVAYHSSLSLLTNKYLLCEFDSVLALISGANPSPRAARNSQGLIEPNKSQRPIRYSPRAVKRCRQDSNSRTSFVRNNNLLSHFSH